jgi:hypothetical protein
VIEGLKELYRAGDESTDDTKDNLDEVETATENLLKNLDAKVLDFYNVGTALMEGLILGIKDRSGDVTAAIEGVIGKGVDAANVALEVGSPSKVFWEIGMNAMRGLRAGFEEGVGSARLALADIGGGWNIGSADYNLNRTITVEFIGHGTAGAIPLNPFQLAQLKEELAYQIRLGA